MRIGITCHHTYGGSGTVATELGMALARRGHQRERGAGSVVRRRVAPPKPFLKRVEAVAVRIRSSSGGLPALKALGLIVGGRTQVSMNLTDFRQTSLRRAFDAVRAEAGRLGAEIDSSELIGLIPQEATLGWSAADIQLKDFSDRKILECRLMEVGLIEE